MSEVKKDADILACQLSHLEERHEKLRTSVKEALVLMDCGCPKNTERFKNLWSAVIEDIVSDHNIPGSCF